MLAVSVVCVCVCVRMTLSMVVWFYIGSGSIDT